MEPTKEAAKPESVKDKKKREKAEKAEEERRKRDVLNQYRETLAKVESLREMTSTQAWRNLFAHLGSQMAVAKEKLIDAKSSEIPQYQQRVKVIRDILDHLQAPINALNAFVDSKPLFAPTDCSKAEWNKALGTVVLRKV